MIQVTLFAHIAQASIPLLACSLVACQRATSHTATSPATASLPQVERQQTPSQDAPRAFAAVSSSFLGTSLARISIVNRFFTPQFVFVDDHAVATIRPKEEASFDVSAGPHLIVTSDSPDGKLHPLYFAEVYEAGFQYRYEVVAR